MHEYSFRLGREFQAASTRELTMVSRLDLDPALMPRHIACIPDGNGRWAQRQGRVRINGHSVGARVISDVVLGAADLGIEWFTIYAFSTENWQRPESEIAYLMGSLERAIYRRMDEFMQHNVRLRWIGSPDTRIPYSVREAIDYALTTTASNTGMTFAIAFNYGGRTEIVDAIRRMIEDGVAGSDVNDTMISRYLYAPDMPDPDLLIRTSGESRISNFLLWQLAYSELVFSPVLWPEFTGDHLVDAIREYQRRNRRFGGLDAGMSPGHTPPTLREGFDTELTYARAPSISFS
ncbi:polyprenyl diphosphate synthase [Nocardia sp. NPDC051756]|uniref:polyprenyl diphosphate synthase n=1 Tax=Nocardia sp. NPDC051756 TaxID=3154751 RepID=UPI003422ADB7